MLYMPREEGQGLVEYALILVLVAIVVIAVLLILGPAVGNVFSNIVANV
jgi:pilus assembly protein Flp/PilA